MVANYNRHNSTWSTSYSETITGTEHTPTCNNYYYYEVTSTVYVTPAIKIKPMIYKTYLEKQKLAKQEVLESFPVVFKEPMMFNNQNKHVDPKNRLLSKLGKGLHSYQ